MLVGIFDARELVVQYTVTSNFGPIEEAGAVAMTERKTVGRLHVLTDESSGLRHLDLARLAVAGGADTVQFREKRAVSTAWLVAEARQLREELCGHLQLVINDRVDVAAACGACGLAGAHRRR